MNWGLSVKVSFVVPVTRPDDARELYRSLVRNIPESEREIVLVSDRPVPGTEDSAVNITTPEKHASVRRNLGVKHHQVSGYAFWTMTPFQPTAGSKFTKKPLPMAMP